MNRLPWTKLQDFYLRLGFLKILVAALSPERRSIYGDAILRRIETSAFAAAASVPSLWNSVRNVIDWYGKDHARGKKLDQPSVSEAQLVATDHPSFLYGITRRSAIKVIDWGHDVALMGAGHQITERGLLFRSHLPVDATERFFKGDLEAWNPFPLDLSEKILFLYHLSEIDHVTLELAADVAGWTQQKPMEAANVSELLCKAMVRVLARVKDTVRPVDVPAYRIATELARTICLELDLQSELKESGLGAGSLNVPRLPPVKKRVGVRPESTGRAGSKSADHQAIPRAEQLLDLGFLEKPLTHDNSSSRDARRRWRYAPTAIAHRWLKERRQRPTSNAEFLRDGFARTAVIAYQLGNPRDDTEPEVLLIGRYFWDAYQRVGRRLGNSPLDTIALEGMASAAVAGQAIEMAHFERLMVAVKKLGAIPESAFFAGGNDLDTMFVRLKSGFQLGLEAKKAEIQATFDEISNR
jgi:hypothetical protein